MTAFSGVTVVLMAMLGGFWGWRIGSKRLYRRSIYDDDDRALSRRRRKAERYMLAALYAASAAAGIAVLVMLMTKR
jgi:hypothetical protein